MEIDWSKAPEGATHFGPKHDYLVEHWFRKAGGAWDLWQDGGWSPCVGGIQKLREDTLIQRPQPQPWNGEGLPPVGTTCERRFPDIESSSWQGGIVLAHGSRKIFFRDNCGDEWAHSIDDVEFRPFRTPEQIAEEARLAELNEMVRNVKDHPRGRHGADHLAQLRIQEEACIDLYDAGYRKQVMP